MKILLVEDNEMNRDMLSRRLVKRGYEVVMAVDGKQGVDMASSEDPELILLDMSLPVLDGWEAARLLKSNDETASIPIIALTAHARGQAAEDRTARRAAGHRHGLRLHRVRGLLPLVPLASGRRIRAHGTRLPGAPPPAT